MAAAAQSPRIVSLLDYRIDIAPGRESLVFEYVDAPGRIGTIGTVLGEAGVNITTMQVGAKPEERCALVYVNVEGRRDRRPCSTACAAAVARPEEPLAREAVGRPPRLRPLTDVFRPDGTVNLLRWSK